MGEYWQNFFPIFKKLTLFVYSVAPKKEQFIVDKLHFGPIRKSHYIIIKC